jgi:hypothetical protein
MIGLLEAKIGNIFAGRVPLRRGRSRNVTSPHSAIEKYRGNWSIDTAS